MNIVHEIVKYPNRRLYDRTTHRYVKLPDLRKLVVEDVAFRIMEKRTHVDVTRHVLLQIIAEQEQSGLPTLSVAILRATIRKQTKQERAPADGAVHSDIWQNHYTSAKNHGA